MTLNPLHRTEEEDKMENLAQFRARTAFVWDSLPREGRFVTNPKLAEKVGEDGRLLPFYGDTVLYELSVEEKAKLAEVRRALCAACGELLAEPLDADCFHITLHDLNSSPELARVTAEMERTRRAAQALLSELPEELRRGIALRATAAFSMVNTSVVLGFEPASEVDCAALMELYERFQGVLRLNHPLTPHATLAYYRPGDHGVAGLQLLRSALSEINRARSPIELRLRAPVYRRFTDMNHYLR